MIIFRLLKTFQRFLRVGPFPVLFWALMLNIFFGLCFYLAEHKVQEGLTVEDSLWWSMVTMTTVGYGDIYAKTTVGRFLISYPCMFLGIGVIGYLVGVVANVMFDWASRKRRGELKITAKNHIIICHYPSEDKIISLVKELHAIPSLAHATFVLITDIIDELPERLMKLGVQFVSGASNEEETLHRANILESAGVIVLAKDPQRPSSDDRAYTTGSLIEMIGKEHNRNIKTVVELVKNRSQRTLARTNVDGTVTIDGVSSCLLAQEFLHPGISQVVHQMITATQEDVLLFHATQLVKRTVRDLRMALLEKNLTTQVIGLVQAGKILLNPELAIQINQGDQLILMTKKPEEIFSAERALLAPKLI